MATVLRCDLDFKNIDLGSWMFVLRDKESGRTVESLNFG